MPLPDEQMDALLRGQFPPGDALSPAETAERAAIAHLFAAAGGPPTDDELVAASAAAAAFTARAALPAAASTSRSRTMKPSTRIPRRVIAATVGVLLTAGTAAAASGVLTTDRTWDRADVEETATSIPDTSIPDTSTPDSTVPDTTVPTDDTVITDPVTTDAAEPTDTTVAQGPDATGPAAYGLCTAWSNGHEKNMQNPAFGALQAAADAAGQTVEEYCAAVLDAKDATRGHDDADDDADDEAVDEGDDDQGDHDQGDDGHESHGSDHGRGQGQGGGKGHDKD